MLARGRIVAHAFQLQKMEIIEVENGPYFADVITFGVLLDMMWYTIRWTSFASCGWEDSLVEIKLMRLEALSSHRGEHTGFTHTLASQ